MSAETPEAGWQVIRDRYNAIVRGCSPSGLRAESVPLEGTPRLSPHHHVLNALSILEGRLRLALRDVKWEIAEQRKALAALEEEYTNNRINIAGQTIRLTGGLEYTLETYPSIDVYVYRPIRVDSGLTIPWHSTTPLEPKNDSLDVDNRPTDVAISVSIVGEEEAKTETVTWVFREHRSSEMETRVGKYQIHCSLHRSSGFYKVDRVEFRERGSICAEFRERESMSEEEEEDE